MNLTPVAACGVEPKHAVNPFDNPKLTELLRRERQENEARDDEERRTADARRLQDASAEARSGQERVAAVDEAMNDLRRVMAANADVLTSSEILDHVARFADARAAERYAAVYGVLMRAVLAVPPQVTLPPIIGGEVSLNLLLAAVGSSGAGKGTTDKTAAAAVAFLVGGRRKVPTHAMIPLGTGEGINRTYASSGRDKVTGRVVTQWHSVRAQFGVRDIATLDALTRRQGATLLPELLKAFMGEELGFANADKDRRVILPMHTYRLCLSAGVQPENGAVLLNDQARRDGVPQRFIWTPVRPGFTRPRREARAVPVDPLDVTIPGFDVDPLFDVPSGEDDSPATFVFDPSELPLVHIGVASSIAQQIIDTDAAKDADPFGRSGDPLAGHRLLTQLKIAAALAVLHNRTDVGVEDWQRAERLIEVSSAVVRAVSAESDSAQEDDAVHQGKIHGHRLAASDDARSAATLAKVSGRLVRYLGEQTDWVSHGTLRKSLTAKLRVHFDDALDALRADGKIERRTAQLAGQGAVVQYRIKAT